MKKYLSASFYLITIIVFFLCLCAAKAETTNGVFYVKNPITSTIITQAGQVFTNELEVGKTYVPGFDLVELSTTNESTILFSNSALIKSGSNSKYSILSFDQDIQNIYSVPQKSVVGDHTLNLMLVQGEFSIIYPNTNINSRLNVTTRYASYELIGGKYFFRVGKSAIVYVLEGGMIVHSDKNKNDSINKGNLSIAIPFTDVDSGLDDKFMTTSKKAQEEEMKRFRIPFEELESSGSNIGFFIIDGKMIGIQLK